MSMKKTQLPIGDSEDGGGAMSQGSFEEMEKPENRFFPLGLRKECMPAENLILSH